MRLILIAFWRLKIKILLGDSRPKNDFSGDQNHDIFQPKFG